MKELSVEWSPSEYNVILTLIRSVTVPILYQEKELAVSHATGTFFRLGGRYFIVLSAHTFNDVDIDELAIPIGNNNREVYTLGRSKIFLSETGYYDVAAV